MKKNNIKNLIMLLSSVILIVFVFLKYQTDIRSCLGIPLVSADKIQEMTLKQVDLENIVNFQGHLAPYDTSDNCIYISCDVADNMKFHEIKGQLESTLLEYKLYFVWEDAYDNLTQSVRNNHRFQLYAIDSLGNYTSYYVVFTTLPMVEMHGECIGIDEQERELFYGEITVWEPANEETGRYLVQTSDVEWHVRGYTSSHFAKKPWRISLKDKNGENNKLSLVGLESDDDYMLNPMWYDDLKVREKLSGYLWNKIAEQKCSTLKMAGAEYCELIIDGEYQGLRLIQNKIEKGYLSLDEDDYLFKGKNKGYGECPRDVYDIIYAVEEDEELVYAAMDGYFYQTDFSNINIDNWIDFQLYIIFGNMIDNYEYKNVFYVLERGEENGGMSFVPWDTDMSFGVYWTGDFIYLPESVEEITYRMDYPVIIERNPELEDQMAERWRELRENVIAEADLFEKIDMWFEQLDFSGALIRDYDILNKYAWGGEDTRENLKIYIHRRLENLDNMYGLQ